MNLILTACLAVGAYLAMAWAISLTLKSLRIECERIDAEVEASRRRTAGLR